MRPIGPCSADIKASSPRSYSLFYPESLAPGQSGDTWAKGVFNSPNEWARQRQRILDLGGENAEAWRPTSSMSLPECAVIDVTDAVTPHGPVTDVRLFIENLSMRQCW